MCVYGQGFVLWLQPPVTFLMHLYCLGMGTLSMGMTLTPIPKLEAPIIGDQGWPTPAMAGVGAMNRVILESI